MNFYENEISPDDWKVSDMRGNADDEAVVYERKLRKHYDAVKREINPIDGLSIKAPDFATVIATKKREKSRAVQFSMELKRSQLALTVGTPGGTQFVLARMAVPGELEDYRTFLEGLSGWSDNDHPLVTEAAFKDWSRKNPKKPTVYKSYDELVRKSRPDAESFRAWARANSVGKKVLDEQTRTDKLKPADPARVKVLKAMDVLLAAYYKTF